MNDQLERLLAGPLVWLSTLHAAAEVIRTRQERLRGNDPSDLEDPGSARRHIRAALRELEEHALRLSVLQSDAVQIDDDVAHAAASFDSLIITNRCGQLLEDVHGRLMSLYPDVDVHVVEETRVRAADCRDSLGKYDTAMAADTLFAVCREIRRQVLSGSF